ncbi:bifunctional methylenetetrahydrofolate dehydrogenase/methenyltetrahydrofolate cyclohydrolase FolD [Neomoorella thermoacetica]|uniref:Bifunctional protein FolD n=3 Tax=Neomoorella thermoacetica TaxID=1525 RepID=FOLD_MOOTA|nr:bifunctional methylenetetrahydrofolate dehydrogenase/methenyltetrahydrofolate cyclohydrolase FolD [Moorella thermoacetica]Q2RIB4.1 RecName: Full=Bifunctional protein FolD; Includes: RecName: Full=Methylenetetrahydrofolate dehydrogenase; Includes: RecName: Full=Methenyltetrahydrofolate cyclohydrolase [Moorella thermoacetica ATCC 39073]AKX94301.1 bifunctional protein FolD protein [Moorella thermoacetica]AKX96938.1 bifunctional protein FolD protein [Moorella thermoacetica]AOQ24248.1 Bifunctiona
MPAQILDGKKIAAEVRAEVKEEVSRLKAEGINPGLAVVLVGEDPASQVYVRNKHRACEEVGIYSEVHRLPAATSQAELLKLIDQLNKDPKIHGILVQLPLPDHIDEKKVIDAIALEKDVDGFSPANVGNLVIGDKCFYPCTPHGCMVLLEKAGIDPKGKKAVVVGRSNIVGKPVAMMLLARHATVTICHSRTRDLAAECRQADILIAAVGKPELITGDMIKEGAVVIDVGINRVGEKKLVGDVHFESAAQKAGWITPVPGGVGPMTIAMLLKNTVEAARR